MGYSTACFKFNCLWRYHLSIRDFVGKASLETLKRCLQETQQGFRHIQTLDISSAGFGSRGSRPRASESIASSCPFLCIASQSSTIARRSTAVLSQRYLNKSLRGVSNKYMQHISYHYHVQLLPKQFETSVLVILERQPHHVPNTLLLEIDEFCLQD